MLFWLLIIGIIVWLIVRNSSKPRPESTELQLLRRNTEWITFIKGYQQVAKNKAERAIVDRMLRDVQGQGLAPAEPDSQAMVSYSTMQKQAQQAATLGLNEQSPEQQEAYVLSLANAQVDAPKPKVELDNTTLLLYFGAFLFVASVGLFITFGGANGVLRTVAVLVVMATLYSSGVWIHRTKPKLQQAGLAFAGIGMTIAPLAGVAAYYYLLNQSNGPAVWFVTSVVCLGMYAHALFVLRKPLINYILIFTFLSLFESGVSILSVPIYYFGWAMAFVGILLVVFSRLSKQLPELQESSRISSQLFLPVALFISLVMLPQQGAGQLGVSLLFAAAFYGLEILATKNAEQQGNALAAHVALLAGVSCISYSFTSSWSAVAVTILILNVIQLFCIIAGSATNVLWKNFASIVLIAGIIGSLLGFAGNSAVLLASTMVLLVAGMTVWLRQSRIESYVLGCIGLMALPLVYGQSVLTSITAAFQAQLLLGALIMQLLVYFGARKSPKLNDCAWAAIAQQTYTVSLVGVLFASGLASISVCFILSLIGVATTLVLGEIEHDGDWGVVAGVAILAPFLRSIGHSDALIFANMLALILNIFLALRYRKEANRWLSSILWFILPISLGTGYFGHWPLVAYAWAYVAVMLGLILSRAIARGRLLISGKVPLQSYTKTASLSYVVGYTAAGTVAIILALASSNSQLHASLIIALCMVIAYVVSKGIEKRDDLLALQPLLAQLLIWSVIRPTQDADAINLFPVVSSAVACAIYFLPTLLATNTKEQVKDGNYHVRLAALVTAYVAPAAFLSGTVTVLMPLGLIIAGLLTYYHNRQSTQANREFSLVIAVAGLEWLLFYAGVREVQAFTHVLVATFGIFAYWRAIRNEKDASDQYLLAMLATATVPLALQAIAGQAGGLYGWWLLLEQIAFMLLGMAIHKRVVIRWGLYVAVASVLYQLRDLGWAALTVLALFLIGLAVYNLQKRNDKN